MFTIVPNKSFGHLLHISPENVIFLKAFNSEFLFIKIWFTCQNAKLPEIKDRANINLVIHNAQYLIDNTWKVTLFPILHLSRIIVTGYGHLFFAKIFSTHFSTNLSGKHSQ